MLGRERRHCLRVHRVAMVLDLWSFDLENPMCSTGYRSLEALMSEGRWAFWVPLRARWLSAVHGFEASDLGGLKVWANPKADKDLTYLSVHLLVQATILHLREER